jgi:hypothetical protein
VSDVRRELLEHALLAGGVDSVAQRTDLLERITQVLGDYESASVLPRPVMGFYLLTVETSVPSNAVESEIVAVLDAVVATRLANGTAELESWQWADGVEE